MVKLAKVGVYGGKTRALQKRMAYEAVSLTWKIANVYRYLGSRANDRPTPDDVQVTTFMEVPDRAYDQFPVPINIYFEPAPEQVVDYSQFGVIDPLGGDQIIRVHMNSDLDLGRKLQEGDVIEIPFFRQGCGEALWEVTDVDGSQTFEKFYYVVKLKVLEDSRETREINIQSSIGPSLDDIVDQHTDHATGYVPHPGVDDSDIDNGETNPDIDSEYSGTKQNDRDSFLDEFNGDLL